jgi:hypothetical protein
MTQDEIIEMARQAGFENCNLSPIPAGNSLVFLEAFAKLVAAKERERIKEENQRCYVAKGQAIRSRGQA